jgi:excinuclease ABC subunit B
MQTAGRAARNVDGKVIMYADTITGSMKKMIDETNRRREIQRKYNEEHGITPRTVYKSVEEIMSSTRVADAKAEKYGVEKRSEDTLKISDAEWSKMTPFAREEMLDRLEKEMLDASKKLDFERAAELRDEIERLKSGKKKGRVKYQFAKKT